MGFRREREPFAKKAATSPIETPFWVKMRSFIAAVTTIQPSGLRRSISNTSSGNTATGANALQYNTTGGDNTAAGAYALYVNTTGDENTTMGRSAMQSNTTGSGNTATGFGALFANTTGFDNTVTGRSAFSYNTTGNSNIALGVGAGANITTGSDNIDIGNAGVAGETNIIRIGTDWNPNSDIYRRHQWTTVTRGVATQLASLRWATWCQSFLGAIQGGDQADGQSERSDFLAQAGDVSLQEGTRSRRRSPQFGLVAEQVDKVNPDLVARDAEGKPYTVRYDAVNAMLLNEFLKEHRGVRGLSNTVATNRKR